VLAQQEDRLPGVQIALLGMGKSSGTVRGGDLGFNSGTQCSIPRNQLAGA
jgi:hypothetical protein